MKNYIQPGGIIEITSAGAITSGSGVLINSLFGVAVSAAAGAGEKVSLATEGVFTLPKVGTQAWEVGVRVYWDGPNDRLTTTAGSLKQVGVAVAPVAGGAGDTTGTIKLIGCPVN